MKYTAEDLETGDNFKLIAGVPYSELVPFIFGQLKKVTVVTIFFWTLCLCTLLTAFCIRLGIESGIYAIIHSLIGFILLPVLIIPVHELLHVIPFYLMGARNIKIGMDLKQFFFYVTAHRHVAEPLQFILVALVPFLSISFIVIILIFILPGAWKWSLSAFLFIHTTMCAGDVALLSFYFINRRKKIYTWDDAYKKVAYFYERKSV